MKMNKKIVLIYTSDGADAHLGMLAAGRLIPALEALGASTQVYRASDEFDPVLNDLEQGALPIVIHTNVRE